MTVWALPRGYLAVGIHVPRPPRYPYLDLFMRHARRVHLRIHCSDTVLTSIWHCLALIGTVWPYDEVYGTLRMRYRDPGYEVLRMRYRDPGYEVLDMRYMDPGYEVYGPWI